ncbi:hypothetical protein ZHAS_00000382 [Anopheles sinensis]|uniref:Uncharacterized protein n=1 Tax=Anopheles sinensis TaxID=74873 RepID=A0A084VA51_ANOSI|nr:hypothetical protein ZHAS_00000382 [Anopheles sinensis]
MSRYQPCLAFLFCFLVEEDLSMGCNSRKETLPSHRMFLNIYYPRATFHFSHSSNYDLFICRGPIVNIPVFELNLWKSISSCVSSAIKIGLASTVRRECTTERMQDCDQQDTQVERSHDKVWFGLDETEQVPFLLKAVPYHGVHCNIANCDPQNHVYQIYLLDQK